MTPNGMKVEKKNKGDDATYTLATLPDIVIMGPNRKLKVTNGSAPFKFRFKDEPGDPPELNYPSKDIGGVQTIEIKLRNSQVIEAFAYDIITGEGAKDPIIIIDPQ